jgi:hypothetical protein
MAAKKRAKRDKQRLDDLGDVLIDSVDTVSVVGSVKLGVHQVGDHTVTNTLLRPLAEQTNFQVDWIILDAQKNSDGSLAVPYAVLATTAPAARGSGRHKQGRNLRTKKAELGTFGLYTAETLYKV